MIVAHLDLDAFFAAVEELESPELRGRPLVVGGDPHGRGVVATANYAARRLRHPLGDVVRRGAAALPAPSTFVRPRHSLYRQYSQEVWSLVREIVPTVEQAGIDEGYLDLGEVAPAFDDARALAESVQAVDPRAHAALVLARARELEGRRQDRLRPPQARRADDRAPGPRGGVPRAARDPPAAGDRPARRGAPRSRAASRRSATLAALTDDELRALLPGKVGRMVRDRARGIDPRPLEVSTERISISHEETFPQDVGDPERLHDELTPHGRAARRAPARAAARPRARSRRSSAIPTSRSARRSTSLPVGTDDAARIGELACALLDRALRDRPGPLRLVGVGVSGLAEHAQLELSLTGAR